jgi:uncharacterized small protein (DUF1192 family)
MDSSPAAAEPVGQNGGPLPKHSEEAGGIPLFRARSKAKEFRAKYEQLYDSVEQLGLLSTIELEQRQAGLQTEIEKLSAELARERADATASVERETAHARERAEKSLAELSEREQALAARVAELDEQVVVTEETSILQEVGIYE